VDEEEAGEAAEEAPFLACLLGMPNSIRTKSIPTGIKLTQHTLLTVWLLHNFNFNFVRVSLGCCYWWESRVRV
jgi:hypothetical protein